MGIPFHCSACGGLIKIGDEFAGCKVRCPKCQAVVQAPEGSPPAPAAPVATAFAEITEVEPLPERPPSGTAFVERLPERPRELAAVAGIPAADANARRPTRRASAEDDHADVRDEPGSTFPVGLALGVAGGGLLVVAAVAVALVLFLRSDPPADDEAGPPLAAHVEGPKKEGVKADDEKPFKDGLVKKDWVKKDDWAKEGRPKDDKLVIIRDDPRKDERFKDDVKEGVFKDEFIKDGFPPDPPFHKDLDRELKKGAPEPPVRAVLDKGRYETAVNFDPKAPGDGAHVTRRYEFDAKAGVVYWVRIVEGFRHAVEVTGPAGPIGKHDRSGDGTRETAFIAKAGKHAVTVLADRFDAKSCRLEIRAMDGSEALPTALRIKTGAAVLPDIRRVLEMNVHDKQFFSAAFSPDSKFFFIAHGDKTVSYWELPDVAQKGSFTVKEHLSGMGVDSKGRLYAQKSAPGPLGPVAFSKADVGDIHVWDVKPGGIVSAKTKSLPLHGIVQRFVSSPDGRWLYYLDTHNRKLGRIDVNMPALDKDIDTLAPGASAMSMTPDGKKIYVASTGNKIDVIDTATFTLERTVSIDRGKPRDLAATNEGLVYLVGMERHEERDFFGGSTCMVADLRGPAKSVKTFPLNVGHLSLFVQLLPDQRAVLFSGDRKVTVCSIPDQPALMHTETREQTIREYFMPGQIILSPDGRILLQDTGVILSVSR